MIRLTDEDLMMVRLLFGGEDQLYTLVEWTQRHDPSFIDWTLVGVRNVFGIDYTDYRKDEWEQIIASLEQELYRHYVLDDHVSVPQWFNDWSEIFWPGVSWDDIRDDYILPRFHGVEIVELALED